MRLKRTLACGLGAVAALAFPGGTAGAHEGHAFEPGSNSGSSSGDKTAVLETRLMPLNGSSSSGGAFVRVDGNTATVKLRTASASKDMRHAQHIHIGGQNTCPPSSADSDGDGFISVVEGVPFYGGVAVSLTTAGDVSSSSALAVDRFPTGDGNFVTTYERTFTLPEGVTAADVAKGVIVQHGISELFDDNYRYDGAKRSEIAPALPFEATVPSSCGALSSAGTMAWGLTANNELLKFSTSNPELVIHEVAIGGLVPGEQLIGIDVRPATGELYALGSTNRLYVIDSATGVAQQRGSQLTTPVVGDAVGFDFNPTVDRIRITTNASQNLRVHPDTAVVTVDGSLGYATGDANFGRGARVIASAYTNNIAGAATTSLFNLDADTNALLQQSPPNVGGLNTVGSLGFDVTDAAGFDISSNGKAFAAVNSGGPTQLRTIDLDSGVSTYVGEIGTYRYLRGLTLS